MSKKEQNTFTPRHSVVLTSSCKKDICKVDLLCVCSEYESSANLGLDKFSHSTDTDSGSLQQMQNGPDLYVTLITANY